MRLLPLAGMVVCLAGAAWFATGVDPSAAKVCAAGSRLTPPEVEKSFEEATALMGAGRTVEALLLLEKRAATAASDRGPALYLLGELAYGEGAPARAVDRYIEALKADPSLSDRNAPFGAAGRMAARSAELRKGRWASLDRSSQELARLNYLDRRLGGGCK